MSDLWEKEFARLREQRAADRIEHLEAQLAEANSLHESLVDDPLPF